MSDKAKIRRDFGVEYEIPAMYILDAKFYTGSTSNKYMVRIVKYTRPKNSKKFCVHSNVKVENVRSLRVDIKKKEDLTLRELYGENQFKYLTLELLTFKNGYLKLVKYAYLKSSNFALIEFSPNGK